MSISRRMDKEAVVYIQSGILLSYKKECIWVRSNEVNKTEAYYTEWTNSERETPIQYINAYIWNLVLEKTLESPLDCKEIQPVHSEGDQPWDFFGMNDAKAETPGLRPPHAKSWLIGKDWCWEGLGAGGEGDDRGWDGWMASLTRWTWGWVNSGSWWGTGRPVVLRFRGSQRVGHDWATALIWSEWQSYMKGSKRDTDVKKIILDYVGEGEGGMIWENSIETCVLLYAK